MGLCVDAFGLGGSVLGGSGQAVVGRGYEDVTCRGLCELGVIGRDGGCWAASMLS